MNSTAVIRDTQTGDCFIVPAPGYDGIDTEALEAAGYELAGWLKHLQQYSGSHIFADSEEEAEETGRELYAGPYFTQCNLTVCTRMIALNDFGAPEFCSKHEEAAE